MAANTPSPMAYSQPDTDEPDRRAGMTTETAPAFPPPADSAADDNAATPQPPAASLRQVLRAVDPTGRALGAILTVQAVWLFWAFSRGWFVQADLSNLADAAGRSLNWDYISTPLGGHFAPTGRLTFWLLYQLVGLNYTATVVYRVAAQVIGTWLLYRVLCTLVGRRPLVIGLVAVFAFNPIQLAGVTWFTSGSMFGISQILVLLTIDQHLKYERTHALRHAAIAGISLALAVLSFDQWVIAALMPPLLSFIHLYSGGVWERVRTTLRHWRAWLLTLGPVTAAVILLATLGNPVGAAPISAHNAYQLVRESWLKTLAPGLVGGPWHWYAGPNDFISYSLPPDWMVLLAQFGLLVAVMVGVRRIGLVSLLAWITPVVCAIAGVLLVGYGRFGTYGMLLAITPRYIYELIPFFVIGAALALAPLEFTRGRHSDDEPVSPASTGTERIAAWIALAAVLVLSFGSGARFAARSGESPAHDYVTTLETNVRAHGASVNLWDSSVPASVITTFEPSHRVSDLLRLANVPAKFDDPSSEPLVVTGDGRLAKSVFVAASTAVRPADSKCGTFIHGVTTANIPLDHIPHSAEWFLRLELYQATPSTITIDAVDAHGKVLRPIRGDTVRLGTLQARNLALPLGAPATIRIRSADAGTNLCLTRIAVGGPFPVAGS
jgi:hypothetical protein